MGWLCSMEGAMAAFFFFNDKYFLIYRNLAFQTLYSLKIFSKYCVVPVTCSACLPYRHGIVVTSTCDFKNIFNPLFGEVLFFKAAKGIFKVNLKLPQLFFYYTICLGKKDHFHSIRH